MNSGTPDAPSHLGYVIQPPDCDGWTAYHTRRQTP